MFRLMGSALALAAAVGAAEIPVVRTADVVVVGGSSAAVSAAIAAKEAGAEVFLIAPRPYLGEDVAGTLRVVRDPGDDARAPLFRALFDPAQAGCKGLSYTYTTDVRPNAKIHSDPKGVCLNDGRTGHAAQDSVQFDGDVTVTADLGAERDLAGARLDFYVRLRPREGHWRKGPLDGGFLTQAIRVSTSVDGRTWSESVAAAEPEDAGEAMRTLAAVSYTHLTLPTSGWV